jgi:hypothetical protein
MLQRYEFYFNNLNLSIFKKKTIIWLYVYGVYVFYIYKLNFKRYVRVINSGCVEIQNIKKYKNTVDELNNNSKQITLLLHKKIKFAGKGYKIKKNSNKSLIFLFNRAHLTIV